MPNPVDAAYCGDCKWVGQWEEASKRMMMMGEEDLEYMWFCPRCNSMNLVNLDDRIAELNFKMKNDATEEEAREFERLVKEGESGT